MTVLVRQILAVSTNRLFAFITGVGIKVFVAFHAVGAVLLQDILLTKEGLFAVVAVKAFSHVGVWESSYQSSGKQLLSPPGPGKRVTSINKCVKSTLACLQRRAVQLARAFYCL